ncbi:unnamed protein product [Parajaminaea phylloscopi]
MTASRPSRRSSLIASHLGANGASASRSASTSASTHSLASASAAPSLPSPQTGGGANLDEPKVLVANNNALFEVILNREKAINALDTDMVIGIAGAIDQAAHGRNHSAILIRAVESSRGLCSGGDVLKVVNMANSEKPTERQAALDFFRREFELDWRIAKLGEQVSTGSQKKARPIVSYMDGITMGGGVGLSVHAPFRVATERTMFAMPETGIGYFPDVGVTRVLSRLDGRIGAYLGLTGERITGEEAYLAGLATHFVHSSALPRLTDALAALPAGATGKQVASAIEDLTIDPFGSDNAKGSQIARDSAFFGDVRVALDYVFGQPSVEAVFAALGELAEQQSTTQAAQELQRHFGLDVVANSAVAKWASKTLKTLQAKSPRSLKVSLQAINHEARHLDVDESFRFDMRLATAFCDMSIGKDFYEGVHHVLTKDPATGKRREGTAPWQPSEVKDVKESDVRDLFFGPIATATEAGMTLTPPELTAIPQASGSQEELSRRDAQKRESLAGIGPAGWEPEFNYFHPLPSEAELEALLHGSHPASGSFQIDLSSGDGREAVKEIASTLSSWRLSRGASPSGGLAWGLDRKVHDWVVRRRADRTKKGSIQ